MKNDELNNINNLDFTNANNLKMLIEQTYVIEEEYKNLKKSYDFLTDTLAQIIEVLPSAIWILDKDKNIFLQNKLAGENQNLFKSIDFTNSYYEANVNNNFYLVKIISHLDKTIISATDITTEKRNERLASMGQISAHLAHEIRNPIGSISLLLSTLFGRVEIKNKALVLQMQDAIKRVERIIKHTLLFTKGITLNKQTFNISSLKDELEKIFDEYESDNSKLVLELESVEISADKELLTLVLSNLIYNAIDAISEKKDEMSFDGVVIIKAYKTGKKLTITIEDNGVDIKDDNIFEAYKTTKLKGNGLGLSLSREIINAHQGNIKVNKNPKKFIITI